MRNPTLLSARIARWLISFVLATSCLALFPFALFAQDTPTVDQGTNPYSSLHGGDFDSIVLANGNLLLHIPLISYPQRGSLHLGFFVAYDNRSINSTSLSEGTKPAITVWSVRGLGVHIMGDLPWPNILPAAGSMPAAYEAMTPDGSSHPMASTSDGLLSTDATGFTFNTTSNILTDRNGVRYSGPPASGFNAPTEVEDPNGNLMTITPASGANAATVTDSLGRSIPWPSTQFVGVQTTNFGGCTGSLATSAASTWTVPSLSGGTEVFKICYAEVPLSLDMCGGNTTTCEQEAGDSLIQSIVLPNGTAWTFGYDGDGDLSGITLPTGGTISYGWGANPQCQNLGSSANCPLQITSRSVNANDGSGAHTWTYAGDTFLPSPRQASAITVTDPGGNQTVHTFGTFGPTGLPNGYETQTNYYQNVSGTQTLLKTVATAYSSTSATFYGNSILANVVPTSVTTTWANSQVSQIQKTYDAGIGGFLLGQVLTESDYDYGSGSPGPLLRKIVTTYEATPGSTSPYLSNNLLSLPASITTYNGSGTQLALTTYGYDAGTPASSGISTQHDSSPDGANPGNQTSVARWLNTTGTNLTSTATFFDTGEINLATDPKGNVTTYAYSSTYAGAYPTTVTNALNQTTTHVYDLNTGQLTSTTDPNSQTTTFTYDPQTWRKTQATFPDGGQTSFCYSDTPSENCASGPPYQINISKKITSNLTYKETIVVDGLGRVSQSQVTSDPEGTVYTNTTFDAEGRKGSVSNPYRMKADPTYGVTSYLYDSLNRATMVIKPDNSAVTTSYAGNVTTVTDEAGAIRQTTADGLGRLIQVNEPSPSSVPSTSGSGSVTLSGSEKSKASAAIPATGSVTIAGAERSELNPGCPKPPPPRFVCQPVYDIGTVSIIVNGVTASYSYGEGDTPTTVAQGLVTAVNSATSSPVTASLSGTTVNLSAPSGNDYTLSASGVGGDTGIFSGSSFSATASGSALTGGTLAGATTTYDSGSIEVTIAGSAYSVPYGNGSTSASLVSALTNAINDGTLVTAASSGNSITLASKMAGSFTNYSLSVSSQSSDQFSPPSFAISDSGADLTGGTDGSGNGLGTPLITLYTYDGLGDLTCVEQHGNVSGTGCSSPSSDDSTSAWRVRRFSYDSLKRLLTSSNPEAGAVTYTYDADSNVATKADARGLTITYSYDKLNRLLGRAYSNGDPAVSYVYDQTATGFSNIGRRTSMTDSGGSESWNYDSMGRELSERRTTNGITKSTAYAYNLDGSLATLTYPSGLVLTYAYDAAARPISAIDQNSVTYGSAAVYAPQGAVSQMQYGANAVETGIYNNRLQPCWIFATTGAALPVSNTTCASTASPAGNILDLKYNFKLGSGDNGNVMGITNNRDTTRSESFTYDQLNRILTAQTSSTASTSPAHCMGEQFSYDAWGNLLSIAVTSSAYTGCTQDVLSATPAVNNSLTGPAMSYDAVGNILADGINGYTWNAESEIKSAAGVNYTYDGDGDRVQKSNGKIYWYGAGSEILDESDLSGNVTSEYIFFGGKRIARRDVASSDVFFYLEDMLGSSRSIVQSGQTAPCYDADFSPFGGERVVTNTCAQNYKFQGKEHDAETNNDNFGARYYSSTYGRFLSADWSAIPVPVPYANLSNPQTLNLYAIVSDNPETFADLDGHMFLPNEPCWSGSADCSPQANQSTTANNQNSAPSDTNAAVQLAKDTVVGAAKEAANTVIDFANLVNAPIDAGLAKLGINFSFGQGKDLEASTPGEKGAMIGMGIVLALVPGGAEAKSADAVKLGKSLASEAQMAEKGSAILGAGTNTALKKAGQLSADYGGKAGDWSKMTSSAYRAGDRSVISTHWYENVVTGVRAEYKSIIDSAPWK